jgi:hypothetical protein
MPKPYTRRISVTRALRHFLTIPQQKPGKRYFGEKVAAPPATILNNKDAKAQRYEDAKGGQKGRRGRMGQMAGPRATRNCPLVYGVDFGVERVQVLINI